MLKTLRHRPPREVAAILAAITLSLLSQEYDSEPYADADFDRELQQEVLNEVYEKLDIQRLDHSLTQRSKIYDFLSQEMSRAALVNANTERLKADAGQRGELRSDLYKIKITDEVKSVLKERKVSVGEVYDAILHPDAVEHLLPEEFNMAGTAVSLYLQTWETVTTNEVSYLLLLTERKGYVQSVYDVIRVYASDIEVPKVVTPLAILQAFLDKYGLLQNIGSTQGTFFLYQRIPFHGDGSAQLVSIPAQPDAEVSRSKLFVKKTPDFVEVAVAYTIAERPYLSDLGKHK